ncbi:MAG: type II toxin-antitoxin system VapC family toxin [Anabaena sp. CoA2_C59]|uniref:Nucleic acid-binding protein n=1 Tax=Aphanizomenon flos-aquae LD13 TaxID=1710894 RepID=A0A1B7VLF0_APHFL|nr:type II toxin-antitoxin system VapC family toxin [Aphanizomenon flos-aquae UKL13-PB]MCE2904668.1 type II toxin-antitoxin system VapC family toxin [Anabaena sp. CoA2_C59]MDJ0506729.1 type II toxin-antitoxin system VapC family toxin [Nostocales cyanobacterium LE14-WE12]MTJ32131.1 type II toxin-antitoxin system VapC family toxin [Aphanizomenon sp. UHCC 0183]OBQ20532.1 MAG: nucleic acid-binding protein [Aphanizomenon flos-aquae LD13]QSV67239.1 MAG: type II toxin-antitoxin system VapC family tox
MSIYILDTNTVTLLQYENNQIIQRIRAVGNSSIFVTTITLEEQLKGRLAIINKCNSNKNLQGLASAHRNLKLTQNFFCSVNLLEFNQAACESYQKLRQQKINSGSQDLRIAAIALVNQAIVVTQNYKDFIKVPNLSIEDWTLE